MRSDYEKTFSVRVRPERAFRAFHHAVWRTVSAAVAITHCSDDLEVLVEERPPAVR
jgi:hypothetical protein